MERMTIRRPDGRCTLAGNGTPAENVLKIPKILERLAAYEDTGISPEEIKALIARDPETEKAEKPDFGICGCTVQPCSRCEPGPCEHRTVRDYKIVLRGAKVGAMRNGAKQLPLLGRLLRS